MTRSFRLLLLFTLLLVFSVSAALAVLNTPGRAASAGMWAELPYKPKRNGL